MIISFARVLFSLSRAFYAMPQTGVQTSMLLARRLRRD